ncbi:3-oxoacyl-ACP reductase [Stackebrandtia nassauensis]|uniref:Short-chain dehydrogenase/reductase SDR n=1 Tax=Stackebrandtia nassauensis (strain DSM 44728 / CIP 108903 / NRRL B-16338 / NBRC 102104 / LLR-40K-21) TaxID=446470 RepID=D3QAA6_STANL|nr:3-oxoacyl-ACP reductase [Stackebrandtia nassauensis]ADD42689.1 short-chain dehydrogenase/reductase SDR [Stackebrandtia nassauensis DSM 44728]
MPDRYRNFANSAVGRQLVRRLGLPRPSPLRRQRPDAPALPGPVLLGGHDVAELEHVLAKRLSAEVHTAETKASAEARYAGLVFDASDLTTIAGLSELYAFFHDRLERLASCGRVLVLGAIPDETGDPEAAATQAALEGFTRSLGKELRAGGTAQLLRLAPGARDGLDATLRFFLSYRSAFVSGQVVTVAATEPGEVPDPARPLDGKVALVTGAARGIGAVTARTLADQGATVVCLDVPEAGEKLATVAGDIGGSALQLNLATDDAPSTLSRWLEERHGGVDIVVHNAGITRDKTLARMDAKRWDSVLGVNLAAPHRVTADLLDRGVLRDGGRVVVLSSVSGIGGNRGQTNYAASKAGLIGLVRALAPGLAERGITANAVAPGFIETRMTAAMPVMEREAGRRLSSLAQGGLPVDVAETIAWLAHPGSAGVTGNVVRVCGQSFLGA